MFNVFVGKYLSNLGWVCDVGFQRIVRGWDANFLGVAFVGLGFCTQAYVFVVCCVDESYVLGSKFYFFQMCYNVWGFTPPWWK